MTLAKSQFGAPGAATSSRTFPGRPELRGCLAQTLGSIADYLPPALVNHEALHHAATRCAGLPAALTRWIYFECRLSPRTSRVDLILEVDDVGRAIIAGETSGMQRLDHTRSSPHWRRLRTFCRKWARQGSLLSRTVDHIWLEFDLPRNADDREPGPPVPGLFVCFGEVPPNGFSPHRWLSIAREALPEAMGRRLPGAWDRMLESCFDRLPSGAYVPYAGMMIQRPNAGVRLCVTRLGDERIVKYAAELGWPGSLRELRDLLSRIREVRSDASVPGAAMMHLDISDRMEPAIGLEYTFNRKAQFGGHLLETPFLNHLVDRGLCSTMHRKALGMWPGGMTMRMRHQFWQALVLRRVNHIKLVHRPGRPLEVKAYLCVGFGAVTRRGTATFGRRALENQC